MIEDAGFYRELVESSTVAVVLVDADAVIRYHSREAGRMLAGRDADLVGTPLASLFTLDRDRIAGWLRRVAAQDAQASTSLEAACFARDRAIEMTAVNLVASPAIGGIALDLVDRTDLRRALTLAEREATIDALTGLPNRRALDERGRMLFRDGTTRRALLAMLDIDNLKAFNDQHGHEAGDEALRCVAGRLADSLGGVATVARVGGDEFGALFVDVSATEAHALLGTACDAVTVVIDGVDHGLTMSCGVASSARATNWLALVRRADVAVYEAKLAGIGRIYFFRADEPTWQERRKRELEALEAADRQVASLQSDLVRLEHEARHDKRTGLLNAAAFDHDLQALQQLSARRGERYAVVLCDLDFFHNYNERYLFQPANETLRRVADALKGACRSGDVVYRYGGEEITVLLPRTDLDAAADLGERLRSRVAELNIPHENRTGPQIVTVSVGVAECNPRDGHTSRRVVDAANRALLAAKSSGRNRVETSSCEE